jgi:hypothetical protein
MKFDEYYKFYLSKHQDVNNRRMHMFGNAMTLMYVVSILIFCPVYWGLLFAPFVVYPFAFLGHWVFEGSKPALFSSNPLMAKMADWRMCWDMLTGKLEM